MNKSHSGSLVHTPGVPEPLQDQPELDLYDDLTVFTDLSPEQRKQQIAQQLAQAEAAPPKLNSSNNHHSSMSDSGFEVVEMSKTRPLIRKPAAKPEVQPPSDGICFSCGVANTPGDLFCESCGAFLEDPQPAPLPGGNMTGASTNCSDCGVAVGAGEVFCPSCGSVMDS
jgi:hypothetical protein